MMYWPWDLIGENMQLCLAGLRDVDRLVEIYTIIRCIFRAFDEASKCHSCTSSLVRSLLYYE